MGICLRAFARTVRNSCVQGSLQLEASTARHMLDRIQKPVILSSRVPTLRPFTATISSKRCHPTSAACQAIYATLSTGVSVIDMSKMMPLPLLNSDVLVHYTATALSTACQ